MTFEWLGLNSVAVIGAAILAAGLALLTDRPGNFPYLQKQIGWWNELLHDLGHSLEVIGVAEGLVFGFGLDRPYAYILTATLLPAAQEGADYLRFRVLKGIYGFPSPDSIHDPITYLGGLALPMLLAGMYIPAVVGLLTWGTFVAWWNHPNGRLRK